MILDQHGDKIEKELPHRFGQFKVPPDARLTLSRGIETTDEYPWIPDMYANIGKEEMRPRLGGE